MSDAKQFGPRSITWFRGNGYLAGLLLSGFVLGTAALEALAAEDWAQAMASVPKDSTRWALPATPGKTPPGKIDSNALAKQILVKLFGRFPQECDWLLQDWAPKSPAQWWLASDRLAAANSLLEKALKELPADRAATFRERLRPAVSDEDVAVRRALQYYQEVCRQRRRQRLSRLADGKSRIVFTKFQDQGQGYTPRPAVSDGRGGGFSLGGALCLLEFVGGEPKIRTLVDAPRGMIRDPDVSFDGRSILFAWRKNASDDFHLYVHEMEMGTTRQLTSGQGVADYQGKYLPDGGIVFSSTRCVQTCDCIDIDVSNLYRCQADGSRVRRLGFDQVSTCYPSVMLDGRVLYTRWEYNDRGQIFPQPLFVMNPDGTRQVGYYKNSSWFPTAIHHARAIQGTQKLLAVLSGHHTPQLGELALVDVSQGREEADGIECVAPRRKPKAVREDVYGQRGDRFQYPLSAQ